MTPRLGAVAIATALSLSLAACGSSDPGASADSENSASVEHAMGTTDVPCEPKKVVTLGQGQTDSVLALGVTPVGVVEPWTDDWYEYLPDEVEEAEVVGTEIEPDLEKIASLKPDLILGSKLRHEALYDKLSKIAPTVVSETIGVSWKDNVSLWAESLCRPQEGEKILADYEKRVDGLSKDLVAAGKADTEASVIRFMPDEVRIYLTGFPGSVLRDVGLKRPKAQRVKDWEKSEQLIEISEERIPEMDGDVIFQMVSSEHYAQKGNRTLDEQLDHWTKTDLWKNLSAVKRDDVVIVDESHWNLGGGIGSAHAMLDDLEDNLLTDK
ncbi:hypothetical protein ASG73_08980 [Janibacter sp. Soil728]|uniref:ABC transporter substrate-binding protein n=1 Tax=Janibacter sp. Soil728 TaxID=1736393 RepID=UPI0006F1FF12|nr:iron-siderophore ABC transporter substrate-binding protein [Janibacter sp. Soil728]KRE37764.1 hypothetical protein ASG73_08980 [Janibacter sp. Soil728]